MCKEAGSIWKRCDRSFSLSHKLTFTGSWWKYLSALFEKIDEGERVLTRICGREQDTRRDKRSTQRHEEIR
jgi:hypothetical protein